MNWRRGQAYGQDLRDRVLAAMGEPIRMVAARFGVSASYVSKVRSRLRKTGETTAGPQRNQVAPRLAPLYEALSVWVAEHSDATIAELRAWVAGEHGIAVSYPVMWKTLARLGLTLKKTPASCRTGSRRHRRSARRMDQANARTRQRQAGVSR